MFHDRTSIKPSVFAQASHGHGLHGGGPGTGGRRIIAPGERVPESPIPPAGTHRATLAAGGPSERFRELTANSIYDPTGSATAHANGTKRPGDGLPGLGSRFGPRLSKYAKTSSSARAQEDGAELAAVKDWQQRISINRMRQIVPAASVKQCIRAMRRAKWQWAPGLRLLAQIVEEDNSLPGQSRSGAAGLADDQDDDGSDTQPDAGDAQRPAPLAAKQRIKSHARIQDRYAGPGAQPPTQPLPSPARSRAERQQPEQPPAPVAAAKPPLRRLVRGARPSTPATNSVASSRASSPASSATPVQGPTPADSRQGSRLVRGKRPTLLASSDVEVLPSDDADDAVAGGHEEEEEEADEGLDAQVLHFFNTCSVADLADIAELPAETAEFLTSKRPFATLQKVRLVTSDSPAAPTSATSSATSKRSRAKARKAIGDRIVDKVLDMWTGYEAVDALVTKCESLGRVVAEEMKKWGVDIFGDATSDDKELEMVSLDPADGGGGEDDDSEEDISARPTGGSKPGRPGKAGGLIKQPDIMPDSVTLKNYQIVGINWLSLLFRHQLSCILADDMGLGKTAQVIAFLAHLYETGVRGPHLVVVPSSTLENWLREFAVFCPSLKVMPYYAGQREREAIRMQIVEERKQINVVVTTYTIAKAKIDASFLRSMDFTVCVYDEGHMLKNSKSVMYEQLVRIPAQFRLLLTGTPLQNNLQELVSLLGFILPSVFRERKHDLEYIFSAKAKTVDDTHANLLSAQRIARAKSMLTPFVLRRKKHQVIDLPEKINRVEYCELNDLQRQIYDDEIQQVKELLLNRAQGKKPAPGQKSGNNLMRLRQAALHPLFFRKIYDDKVIQRMSKAAVRDDQWAHSDPSQIYLELQAYNDFECHTLCVNNPTALSRFRLKKQEWMQSGKVDVLCKLLRQFKANGDRTLIFSQFTMAMDMLEHVLETLEMGFYRLDGSTSVEDRQAILDAFYENTDIPVFLLSTKAGGAGINLACANKVVIFDSGFNPQDDVQAENRAHRVGQTRPVEVVRLVTRGTIEEQIYALGKTKLALDQRVSGEDVEGPAAGRKKEEVGLQAVESMLSSQGGRHSRSDQHSRREDKRRCRNPADCVRQQRSLTGQHE
ncbi:hypothetical protein KEM52_005700 [Ascosphaera acerosa]|nr:hypothetical protein KEM52_005700 [Ascosphaera acerosa]